MSKFIVNLWDTGGTGRGRDVLKATISDAKDIGVSAYANEAGEAFFTLPWNHPAVAEIQPRLRHYEILRYNGSTYDVMGVGLLDDLTANKDEVVAYGIDYMGLWQRAITSSNTSYTNALIGTILTDTITAQTTHANSELGFLTKGTIEATTKTTTLLTSYQTRLSFFQDVLEVLMDGNSTRPIIQITRDEPFTISFTANGGQDRDSKALTFGQNVNDFDYQPDWSSFTTFAQAIGQKREGASLLFSTQSGAAEATYGQSSTPFVFTDIVNQTALDNKTATAARRLARIPKGLALRIRQGVIVPYDGLDLTDSVPVFIDRGLVQVDTYMTLWGFEWVGKKNGSEDLFLDLQPKEE